MIVLAFQKKQSAKPVTLVLKFCIVKITSFIYKQGATFIIASQDMFNMVGISFSYASNKIIQRIFKPLTQSVGDIRFYSCKVIPKKSRVIVAITDLLKLSIGQ
ncbi:MAG: hypothetical protein COZ24_00165 [Hydrogenophilales bacterium CG_4_10_14_3_um_filter_63_21]|nr:MAG: hypothetical protein COZ24_00165 [Hydrogenophilales bacterium CG_4_10_14_3_um_filter_63_21]